MARIHAKEALLFQEIPTVVTASRQTVSVLESPATATVITREDILHSGYSSVTELLRYVAGVEFFKSNGVNINVGMRGVNGLQANNVLVLVDGRPIYNPVRNTNQCALVPSFPEDIERIEVVKGPGSVLYGSHAFAGVVNIITRSPRDLSGSTLTVMPGTYREGLYSFITGRQVDRLGYKLVGGWTQKNSVADHNDNLKGLLKMSGEMDYEYSPGNKLRASFGFAQGRLTVKNSIVLDPFDQDGFDGYLRGGFNREDLDLDIWWRHNETSGDFMQTGHVRWRFDNVNLTLQDRAEFSANSLIYGAEFRWASLGATTYDDLHQQFIYSLFGEDRWQIDGSTSLFAGLRVDHHPLAGWAFSPRLSLVRALSGTQSIRLSVARAFKYPAYIQSYIEIEGEYYAQEGNRDLDPEKLTSIELAWQAFGLKGFNLSAAAFYNRYEDIIDFHVSSREHAIHLTYDNMCDLYQYGCEFDASWRYSPELLIRANYSYVWKEKGGSITFGPVPMHKINGEVRYDTGSGLWADLRIHWQDKADYSTGLTTRDIISELPPGFPPSGPPSVEFDFVQAMAKLVGWDEMDGYLLSDLSIGYRAPSGRWSAALAIHNLFHSNYREIPDGPRMDTTATARLSIYF
jgi:iron complex outermembrane receptor protein